MNTFKSFKLFKMFKSSRRFKPIKPPGSSQRFERSNAIEPSEAVERLEQY